MTQEPRTITLPISTFFVAMEAIRTAQVKIDCAAGILAALIPVEDKDGDIDLTGRNVEFLVNDMRDNTLRIFQRYSELMAATGHKPNCSGTL